MAELFASEGAHVFLADVDGAGAAAAAAAIRAEGRKATEIVPQPDLLAALGDVYAVLGNEAAALEQYRTVALIGRLARINRQVYNRQLATFYADHDLRVGEARRLALAELRVRNDVYGYDTAAWASYKSGMIGKAARLSKRALSLGTRDSPRRRPSAPYYPAGGRIIRTAEHGRAGPSAPPGISCSCDSSDWTSGSCCSGSSALSRSSGRGCGRTVVGRRRLPGYSARRTDIGLTRTARSAGTADPAIATRRIRPVAAAKVAGKSSQ